MAPLGSGRAGGAPEVPAPSRRDVPVVSSPRAAPEVAVSCLPAQVLSRLPGIPIPEGHHRGSDGTSAPASSGVSSFSSAAARGSLERERGFGGCWLPG